MRWLAWLLVLAIAAYLVMLVPLVFGQRRRLYFPARLVGPASAWGLPRAQTLGLTTPRGERLVAWYEPAAAAKPTILFFHGNGGNLANRVDLLRRFAALGWGYLAVDYPGYGASPGKPTEIALMRAGQTAYANALALGVPASRLVVFGESLGSGVAVRIAAAHPVGALILDSAFSATVEIAAAHYWMFPVRLLMLDQYRSRDMIGRVTVPKLFLHASDDPIVPIRFDKSLFALAREPKTFVEVHGCMHIVADAAFDQIEAWVDGLRRRELGNAAGNEPRRSES